MTGIISVKDFTRNTTKITDHIPGRNTHSYNNILRQLEKYHSSYDRGNWKEFLLLQALYRAVHAYQSDKQTSRSKGIEQLANDTEIRLKALTENIPMIHWPQFDAATLRTGQPDNKSEYDYQIIIQLENDNIVHNAVQKLAAKNPEKTLIVQLDIKNGHSQLVYGDRQRLTGNHVRWVLAGHGNAPQGFISQYMGGFTPQDVYNGVKKLQAKMALRSPQRIVLLGCRLGNNIEQQGRYNSFAQNFISAMHADDKNATTSVRAYSTGMMVSGEGQRSSTTHPVPLSGISWLRETRHRIDLRWNHGLLQSNDIPVILFVVNDIINKRITIEKAIEEHKDILAYCFKLNSDDITNDVINIALLKQVVEYTTYQKEFIAHILKANSDPQRWQGSLHLYNALTSPPPLGNNQKKYFLALQNPQSLHRFSLIARSISGTIKFRQQYQPGSPLLTVAKITLTTTAR